MANKEHNVITDPEIHEPKDASTATAGQVYISDGAGSGIWQVSGGNNKVTVNVKGDFPAPSGGVITLADDTDYIIGAAVSLGTDRIVMGDASSIQGNAYHSPITYTGTGTMFTGVDATSTFKFLKLQCANGKVFDFDDTVGTTKSIICDTVIIDSCAEFGRFNNMLLTQMINTSCLSATQGVTLVGTGGLIWSFDRFALVSTNASFIGINLGTAQASNIEFNNLVLVGPSGAIGISGAASNANVPTGVVATVANSDFSGGMTAPLSGITTNDIRWDFRANSANVADTLPDAMLSLNGNSTETIIGVATTAVLVLGTWTSERSSHFTNTGAGRSTYDGEKDLPSPITISCSVDVASGTNKSVRLYVAINGTAVANSGLATLVDSGSPQVLTAIWQESLSVNDFVEVYVANDTDTVNVTVIDAVLRIR